MARETLTNKQEAFARAVAQGNNLTESYKIAYDTSNMKPGSIHRKASELHALATVRARIEEIAKVEFDKNVAKREEVLSIVTQVLRGIGEEKTSDVLKAAELLARMMGYEAPSVSVGVNLAVRRSPEEMREILRKQVDFSDLDLFEGTSPNQDNMKVVTEVGGTDDNE